MECPIFVFCLQTAGACNKSHRHLTSAKLRFSFLKKDRTSTMAAISSWETCVVFLLFPLWLDCASISCIDYLLICQTRFLRSVCLDRDGDQYVSDDTLESCANVDTAFLVFTKMLKDFKRSLISIFKTLNLMIIFVQVIHVGGIPRGFNHKEIFQCVWNVTLVFNLVPLVKWG